MTVQAQNGNLNKSLERNLKRLEKAAQPSELLQVAEQFSELSADHPEAWLPAYYSIHATTLACFELGDPKRQDALLDEAQPKLEALLDKHPENAEIHVLHAMWCTAKLVVDPMKRGQQYSMRAMSAAGKAQALDPANPRAKYMVLANRIGEAQFFGKDISAYCAEAEAAVEAFDNYPVASSVHPTWGKELLSDQAEACAR